MSARQDIALLLSSDLRSILTDIREALDTLDVLGITEPAVIEPLHHAYRALAGRDYQPR